MIGSRKLLAAVVLGIATVAAAAERSTEPEGAPVLPRTVAPLEAAPFNSLCPEGVPVLLPAVPLDEAPRGTFRLAAAPLRPGEMPGVEIFHPPCIAFAGEAGAARRAAVAAALARRADELNRELERTKQRPDGPPNGKPGPE